MCFPSHERNFPFVLNIKISKEPKKCDSSEPESTEDYDLVIVLNKWKIKVLNFAYKYGGGKMMQCSKENTILYFF